MKNRKKPGRTSPNRIRRLAWSGVVVAIFAIAATAAVSLTNQAKDSAPTPDISGTKAPAAMNSRVGTQMPLDPQTGLIRPLTPQEAKALAAGIKELVNQSTDGLQSEQHADGSVSIDLQGRFQNVAVAKRTEDGKLTQSCVDNPKAAANFFEIDPQLVGVKEDATSLRTNRTASQKGGDQ